MIFLLVWACLATAFAAYLHVKQKRAVERLDRMLDTVLNGDRIAQSDLPAVKKHGKEAPVPEDLYEGGFSMLAFRILRIQEKLDMEVGRAEEEKEQVKQLISNMSHQLKTPLANIMMYQELLEGDGLSDEERRTFLKKLRTQSEKIDWILQSLFKIVRLEQNVIELKPQAQGIKATIQQAVSSVYEKAERKNIEIRMAQMTDRMLWHDRKWTREVFENILENAVKYTDEGGSICIRMEGLEMYTAIHITDNGRGIREEELVKIFGRFYRSPEVENIEGSGIGLYLSRMILEKEKGYMTVSSDYGKGSCFSVYLYNGNR